MQPDYCTSFSYWRLAPVSSKRQAFVLLGEVGKFVPVSPQRFRALQADDQGLNATLQGRSGEIVVLEILDQTSGNFMSAKCIIGQEGVAELHCASQGRQWLGALPCSCDSAEGTLNMVV